MAVKLSKATNGATSPNPLRVMQGLHLGLPGYWYPVLRSTDLPVGHVRGVRRFGIDLALWRDARGRPVIFEDRCAHRAARFSVGSNEKGKTQGDTLTCWYHGWSYDTTGTCVAIPTQPVCELAVERRTVPHYPADERAGFVWMFYTSVANNSAQPPPLQVPSELEDAAWFGFRTHLEWKTNWLNIMDNLSDPMHQYVLHGRSYITNRRPPFNRVRIAEEDDEHLRVVQFQQDEQGQLVTEEKLGFELRLPNVLRVELLNAAPGGNVRVIMLMTPIDAENTYVNYWRGRQVSGWRRLLWQSIWHLFYRRMVFRVASQDEAMLSSLGPLDGTRPREHLAASDSGVIRLRGMMQRAFERGSRPAE